MSTFSSFAAERYPFKTVMVYGSDREGRYDKVIDAFKKADYKVINMFERCDTSDHMLEPALTSDDRAITVINRDFRLGTCCKNWLNTIVAENIWREKQGLPLIPIVFSVGHQTATDKSPTMLSPSRFATRGETSFTSKEVRRAYKLCLLDETRSVGVKTFKFVVAQLGEKGEVTSLTEVPAPWEDPSWQGLWEERMKTHQDAPYKYVRENLPADDGYQPHLHSLKARIASFTPADLE